MNIDRSACGDWIKPVWQVSGNVMGGVVTLTFDIESGNEND